MWRWPFILTLSLSLGLSAWASPSKNAEKKGASVETPGANTSQGPTSSEEGDLLWNQGRQELADGRFEEAAFQLERFIDRYPGHPGYLQAHYLLGQARVQEKKPEKALRPIKYFINSAGKTLPAIQARLWLGTAYLDLEKFHEAFLTSKEIEHSKIPLDHPTQASGLILKARALIGLNQDPAAERALDSAKKLLDDASPSLMASAHWTELKLKTRFCSKFASKGPLDEAQLRDQLERRGTCLLEALVFFRKTLEQQDPVWAEKARMDTSSAFEGYANACEKPVVPQMTKPRKRTKKQLERYRQELTAILSQDCHAKYENALDLLKSWKSIAVAKVAESLTSLTGSVEELSKKGYQQ